MAMRIRGGPEMKLHIACGTKKMDGWLNVDIAEAVQPDMVMDVLKFPWPFDDNSVDEILANHFVEHIGDEFCDFFNECYRVLRHGGTMQINGPYWSSIRCWQDPTHRRALSERLYMYLDPMVRKQWGVAHYPLTCNFQIDAITYLMDDEYEGKPREQCEWARKHLLNSVADINATIRAVKEQECSSDVLVTQDLEAIMSRTPRPV